MAKWKDKSSAPELQETESSYQQYIRHKRSAAKWAKFSISFVVTVIIITAVSLSLAILLRQNAASEAPRIYNVSICGLSLQGLTVDEATALLKQHKNELLPKDEIVVNVHDSTLVLTNEDTHAALNIDSIINAAYMHGRNEPNGNEPLVLDPHDFVEVNSAAIRELFKEFIQPFNGRPTETAIEIVGERPDITLPPQEDEPSQVLTITIGAPKYGCDAETIYRSILTAHRNRNFVINGEYRLFEPEEVTAIEIFRQYCISPVNAKIDPETSIISKEIDGYGFDIASVQKRLNEAQPGDVLQVGLSRIKPSITTEILMDTLFSDPTEP